MAYAYIDLQNEEQVHGERFVRAPIGFSWTFLCFNVLVPLYRHKIKHAIILLTVLFVLDFVLGFSAGFLGLETLPITEASFALTFVVVFFLAFFYNKFYLNSLLKTGYIPYQYGTFNDKTSLECAFDVESKTVVYKKVKNTADTKEEAK